MDFVTRRAFYPSCHTRALTRTKALWQPAAMDRSEKQCAACWNKITREKNTLKKTTAFLAELLIAVLVAGCATSTRTAAPQAKLLVALPDYCNTPDGLAVPQV